MKVQCTNLLPTQMHSDVHALLQSAPNNAEVNKLKDVETTETATLRRLRCAHGIEPHACTSDVNDEMLQFPIDKMLMTRVAIHQMCRRYRKSSASMNSRRS